MRAIKIRHLDIVILHSPFGWFLVLLGVVGRISGEIGKHRVIEHPVL